MSAVYKGVAESDVQSGLYPGLSNDVYHACPGISNSGLGDVERSPAHYYAWHLAPDRPPRPSRHGQLEGNLAHCAILEPDEFDKRYVVGPTLHRGTKAWKEFVAAHPDREAIQGDQHEAAMRQRDAVWAIPDIAEALRKGQREISAFWRDPVTGVLCRCRPDFAHESPAGYVLLDVKTYSDADPDDFRLQIARKGYHRQDAYYSDGFAIASGRPVLAFIFVCVEAEYPYSASAVMLDDPSRLAGKQKYRAALDTYARCLKTNTWPDYSSAIHLVSLPPYALGEYA